MVDFTELKLVDLYAEVERVNADGFNPEVSASVFRHPEAGPLTDDPGQDQGDEDQAEQALPLLEAVLSCLDQADVAPEHSLDGTQEPARVYLTCIQVLQDLGDGRVEQILERAVHFIDERAMRIAEPGLRQSFLQQVPGNAELRAAVGRLRV